MTKLAAASNAYQQTHAYAKAEEATPHELITMLFDGALERILSAKGAMEANDVVVKGMLISKAITIISGLKAYLDLEKGGELAQNLMQLYDYAEEKLFEANFQNDQALLDEVAQIITTLKEGWVGMAVENTGKIQ